MLSVLVLFRNYSLNLLNGVKVKVIRLLTYLIFVMKNCYLLCVIGLIIACIICCRVNVTLDMILGGEDILISWFVTILALLGVASLFVCCMIHCKHLRLSDANKLSSLRTYLLGKLLDLEKPLFGTTTMALSLILAEF